MLSVVNQLVKQWVERSKSIFKNGFASKHDEARELALSETTNPYLAARTEWNFLYNDLLKGKKNWQWVAVAMLIANILLIVGLSRVALHSKYVPYILKVDTAGNTAFGGILSASDSAATPATVNAFIRRYIDDVRSVIADPIAEKKSLNYIYATTRGEALNFINGYYHANDPFKHAKNATVEVEVTSALPKSSKTWQIEWTETQRNLDGGIINQSRYESLITVMQYPVKDEKEMAINPAGLYVTRLSWSQQL